MNKHSRSPEDSGIGEEGAKRLRPDPLPCLKKNNSTEIPFFDDLDPSEQARLRSLIDIENSGIKKLPDNRFLQTFKDGTEVIIGGMSRSELKTAFALEQNVAKIFRDYPIERIGFLTITFPKTVITPKEASRRFNSFNTHFLKDHIITYIKVTEPHKDGRPHYHLLVVFREDIRTGFDWVAFGASKLEYSTNGLSSEFLKFRSQYSKSATPFLRRFWRLLREARISYKLGRTEILPIHSEAEAAVRYVGKYIEKGVVHRTGAWRGVRLVSCARSLERAASCRFAWVKSGARWREFVSQVAARLQIDDFEGFSTQFGSKWAFKLMQCSSYGLSINEAANLLYTSIQEQ